MEVVSVAARTVKRPESILSIRGVFEPATEISDRQVLAMCPTKISVHGKRDLSLFVGDRAEVVLKHLLIQIGIGLLKLRRVFFGIDAFYV